MESYLIEGGHKLSGEVSITGAKNAVLGIIAAACLSDEVSTIENVPHIQDVYKFIEIIKRIGAKVQFNNNVLRIDPKGINQTDCSDQAYNFNKLRASYYLLGTFLGRFNGGKVPRPGGCAIGDRKINLHLDGFRQLGAKVDDNVMITVKSSGLKGGDILLEFPSVGATINLMIAASLAKGVTHISNAAKEPHIVDVANFLNRMGAKIRGAGTEDITITGVDKLHGTEYSVIPDQIETGTYMIAAAATESDIVIKNTIPIHMKSLIDVFKQMGIPVETNEDEIYVMAKRPLKAVQVSTAPYPGFPTDLQQPLAVLMILADGQSRIKENIFESRLGYLNELKKIGAKATIYDDKKTATIDGVNELNGDEVELITPDLRAGAALVIAALVSDGTTRIKDIHYIDRGYEDFEEKLNKLGAKVARLDDEVV